MCIILLLLCFCSKMDCPIKFFVVAPMHLEGVEMVRNALFCTSFGPKSTPKTKFWGKMFQGPHHEGRAYPRNVTIGQQFYSVFVTDGLPAKRIEKNEQL